MWPELPLLSQEGSEAQNKYNCAEASLLEEANRSVTSDSLQGSRGAMFPRGSVFSQIYSTQSLMPDLGQKLSG